MACKLRGLARRDQDRDGDQGRAPLLGGPYVCAELVFDLVSGRNLPSPSANSRRSARMPRGTIERGYLPSTAIEESPSAKQEHDQDDDDECIGVHGDVLTRRAARPSVHKWTPQSTSGSESHRRQGCSSLPTTNQGRPQSVNARGHQSAASAGAERCPEDPPQQTGWLTRPRAGAVLRLSHTGDSVGDDTP
jgi:hypothetical protein